MTDTPTPRVTDEPCVAALRQYQQADFDGVMVLASRQAIEETIALVQSQAATIAEQAAEIEGLTADIDSALKAVTLENEARVTAESANAAQAATIAEIRAEVEQVRDVLAGTDAGSLLNDVRLSRIAEKRMDERYKYFWQVKDTCTRAEAAESALATATAEVERHKTAMAFAEATVKAICAEKDAATARIEKLEAALREVDECFEAALTEGWIDASANGDMERIRDLFTRRIEYARHAAIAALSQPKEP